MEYVKSKKNTSLGKERKIKIEIVKEKGKYTEEMHSVLQDVKPLKLQSTLDGGEKKQNSGCISGKRIFIQV